MVSIDPEGGPLLALVRAASTAGLLSLAGGLFFQCFVTPRAVARAEAADAARLERRLWRLSTASLGLFLGGSIAWLVLQTSEMAGETSWAAVATVLARTRFGHLLLMQWAVSLGVAAVGRRRATSAALAGAALALQAGHGHAAAMRDAATLLAGTVHLVGAAAWLGGLPPLLVTVWSAPPRIAAAAARAFSPLGKVAMVAVAGSAAWQGWVLVGSVPGLVGTAYGWTAGMKLAGFGVLAGFAALNRYRLAPALLASDSGAARRALLCSIGAQTATGLVVVVAAAVLGGLPPGTHVQPVWPWGERLSFDAVREDPDIRVEVGLAVAALTGAGLLALAALRRSRWRWGAAGAAVMVATGAVPHLSPLLVPAGPTSFYRSPTGFAAASIVAGAALYPAHCAGCHGIEGRGDGTQAGPLIPPADLTAPHLWMHTDGELFGWIASGMQAPTGEPVMPGVAGVLSDGEIWALIDFIRARNAGLAARAGEPGALQAPDFAVRCTDASRGLDDLRGHFVRLVLSGTPRPNAAAVTVILAKEDAAASPGPGLCVAAEPVARAYEIATGVQLREALIDERGFLRVTRVASGPDWNDPEILSALVGSLAAHPVQAAAMDRMPM